MANTSLRITILLFALAVLWHPGDVFAQKIYSLGGGSILQTINLSDFGVIDHVTLVPAMSDIAFHENGTLYGVNENNIYKIDTTDGSSTVVKQLPASYGWLVGLTINHEGVFYLSGLGSDKDYIITYNPVTDEVANLGSTGWKHWDLEFYNGQLYLSGGTDSFSQGFLIIADQSDPSKSTVVMDFGVQAYGLTSVNDHCGGSALLASTSKNIIRLDPRETAFIKDLVNNPLYTYSSGTTTRSSYLGSLAPLKIKQVDVGSQPCTAVATTTVSIEIFPGRTGVEYSIDGINYQTSASFTDVPTGIHQAYIRDALGCSDMSDPFEISYPDLDFTTVSTVAHCGENNGTIIPAPTTLNDSIEFSIDDVLYSADPEFVDLPGGDYTIYARTKSGCKDSIIVEIEELVKLAHQSIASPEHCNQSDGTIEVVAVGGKEPYNYSLVALPAQAQPKFTGLHASSFLVRVQDVLGCTSEALIDIETAPVPVISDIITSAAHCDMPDGSVEIIAESIYGNLEYSINGEPFTASPSFTNLGPGVHTIRVADDFGCDTTASFVVSTEDGPIIQNILTEDDFCNSSAGTIKIEATAAIGALTYSLDNGPFVTTSLFSSLVKGDYLVTVRDEFGCDAFKYVTIDESPSPVIETIEVVDATCSESNGVINVLANNSEEVKYSLDNTNFQALGVFGDLTPDEYMVYIADNNGCMDSAMINVAEIVQAEIEDILITNASCNGNDGVLTIVSDSENGLIQYSIDGSNFQINETFSDLPSRTYTGYLIDENGCLDSMSTAVEGKESIELIHIYAVPSNCGFSDGSIHVKTEGYVDVVVNGSSAFTTDVITGLEKGIYNILLINSSECTLDTTIEVAITTCDTVENIPETSSSVYVPNAFSPNGDGVNETLAPFYDQAKYHLMQFQIFDRWGNNVFNCTDLCAWDGQSERDPSPTGVYVYVIQLQDEEGSMMQWSGDITLLR